MNYIFIYEYEYYNNERNSKDHECRRTVRS